MVSVEARGRTKKGRRWGKGEVCEGRVGGGRGKKEGGEGGRERER